MCSMHLLLLLCAVAAANSLPVPEDSDAFRTENADEKLKQTVCVTMKHNPTTQDKGELNQMLIIKTMLGRTFHPSTRQFTYRILTVDEPEEYEAPQIPIKSSNSRSTEPDKQIISNPSTNNGEKLLPNATFENDFRESTNVSRENILRTADLNPNTNNITDVNSNVSGHSNVGSFKPQEDHESSSSFSVATLGQNKTEISLDRRQSNSSGEVERESISPEMDVSTNTTSTDVLHTIRSEIQESRPTNNASQNETKTDVLISTATKINNTSTSSNSTGNMSTESSSNSPFMDVAFNDTSNNQRNISTLVEDSRNNSISATIGTASTSSVSSKINNGTKVSSGLFPVNVSLDQISNDTKIDQYNVTSVETFQTNSTIASDKFNNNRTTDDPQNNFTSISYGNLTIPSQPTTEENGNSESELVESAGTDYPTMTTSSDTTVEKIIDEMGNHSAFNSTEDLSRQEKTLFSDRHNESISDLTNTTSGIYEIPTSTFPAPSEIDSSIPDDNSEDQLVIDQESLSSRNDTNFISRNEENDLFNQHPSTAILTSTTSSITMPKEEPSDLEKEKAKYFSGIEVGSLDHSSEVPLQTTTTITTTHTMLTLGSYNTNGSTVPDHVLDWMRKEDDPPPIGQNNITFTGRFESNNVTEAPEEIAALATGETGDGITESTGYHETLRIGNDIEVSQTNNSSTTTWKATPTLIAENITDKNFSSSTSSDGIAGLASAGSGENPNETTTDTISTVSNQEFLQSLNKTGKALTGETHSTTETPQGIVTAENGKLIRVESLEITEGPDEGEEVASGTTTISSQENAKYNKTGIVLPDDLPVNTSEIPDENEKTGEENVPTTGPSQTTNHVQDESQASVLDNPKTILDSESSENINDPEEGQNKNMETIELSPDIPTDDNVVEVLASSESTDTPSTTWSPKLEDIRPTQGIKTNLTKNDPNEASMAFEEGPTGNHYENSDESVDSADPVPSPAAIPQEELQNGPEEDEWITDTPSSSLQNKLKIENALAPMEPTSVDEPGIEFPTETPQKYSSSSSPIPISVPPSTLLSSLPTGKDWLNFNNFTIVFPTRASFHNRIIYDEQPTQIPGYGYENFYKRYEYPGYMQIVPFQPRRYRMNYG